MIVIDVDLVISKYRFRFLKYLFLRGSGCRTGSFRHTVPVHVTITAVNTLGSFSTSSNIRALNYNIIISPIDLSVREAVATIHR